MKQTFFTRLFLTTALSTSLFSMAAISGFASTPVTAQLNPDITIQIDGAVHNFYNEQGKEIHPIIYQKTVYLPLRSIGALMDKNVNWNNSTNTITLSGKRTADNAAGVLDNTAKPSKITLYLRPEITVVVDDKTRTFHTEDGKQIDPAVYKGSIYLPVHSIGEIMNKTVSWDKKAQMISFNSDSDDKVTDFDTKNYTKGTVPVSSKQKIVPNRQTVSSSKSAAANRDASSVTLEQAKQIALEHAGKTASEVTFVKSKKDYDDRRAKYEIEFIVQSGNGYFEYDYEIDAATGRILDYDYDAEGYTSDTNTNPSYNTISEAQAKKTALARVPGAAAENLYKFKKDFDDGRWEYEGKILYNQMEYEFTIDASSGRIVEWDAESIYD